MDSGTGEPESLADIRWLRHPVQRWRSLRPSSRTRMTGVALVACSVLVTVFLGLRGASKSPPSLVESAIYVVFAGMFQVAGGLTFARIGRADPTHARSAVRRLKQVAIGAHTARTMVEDMVDGSVGRMRGMLGEVSVHLSYIEEGAVDAIADWNEFHQEAIEAIMRESNDAGRKAQP